MTSKPLGDRIRAFLAERGGATTRVIAANVGATDDAVRRYLADAPDAQRNAAGAWRIVEPSHTVACNPAAESARRANAADAARTTVLLEAALRELAVARECATRCLPEGHALRSAFGSVESSLTALLAFARETERRFP